MGEAVLSGWGDFAVVMGAATAALLGLLFVAVSIRVETIAKSAKQRNRSAQTLTLLLTGLLVAALLAVPDQSKWALGAEFLALALVVSGVALILDRRADGQSGSAIGRRLDAINPTFITCSLLVIADDDVEDVIALMRLNYERVVERHALPAVGSRAFRSLSRSPIPPGRIALPGVALVHGHISSAPAVIEVTDENEPTRDERSPGDLSGCSRVPPVGLVQKNGG